MLKKESPEESGGRAGQAELKKNRHKSRAGSMRIFFAK